MAAEEKIPEVNATEKSDSDSMFAFLKQNFLGVSILIAGAMISAVLWYHSPRAVQQFQAQLVPSPEANAGSTVQVDVGNLPAQGNSSAAVTIVEFGDYQCPFCGRFFQNIEPQLYKNYISTGKVKLVWRDYAFLGKESERAAEAARCANDQGKFWQYHDYLFSHQGQENSGAFSDDNLKRFAANLGLDATKFNQCLDSSKYLQAVQNDVSQGSNYGVSGTPTLFINGQRLVGALPYAQFQSVIDDALKN